jgi:hypothetical protein
MTDRPPRAWRGRAAFILPAAALFSVAPAGCSTPLLSPDQPRSQYDRYDAVRAQHASQYKEDEFGQRKPNLRARLIPKE